MREPKFKFIYIPIWTIKDHARESGEKCSNSIYIPIWTIKDLYASPRLKSRPQIYIPIWTIKDSDAAKSPRRPRLYLHSNMDD